MLRRERGGFTYLVSDLDAAKISSRLESPEWRAHIAAAAMDSAVSITTLQSESPKKVDDASENSKTTWTFRACIIAACLNGVAAGNMAGWPMATIPKLVDDLSYSMNQVSWIAGMFFPGMLIGGFASMVLVNSFGKRWLFLIASVPLILGWGIMSLAFSYWPLVISRMILGLGGGLICFQTEMYLSEIATTSLRPRVSIMFCASVQIGVLMGYMVQQHVELDISSNIYLMVVMVLGVLYLLVCPETPYWLVRKERLDEALESLRKLRGNRDVSEEFQEIVEFVERSKCLTSKQNNPFSGIVGILKERANRNGIILVILLTTAQQFSGSAALNNYAGVIFRRSVLELSGYQVSMLMGAIQLMCFLCSSYLVMHTRRRTLVAWGTSLCTGSMALMGLFFHEIKNDSKITTDEQGLPEYLSADNGGLAIVCVVIFSLAYGLGLSTMPTVIAAECLSIDARNLGASIQSTVVCGSIFFITHFWMKVAESLGQEWAFFITAAITGAHCIILLYIQPETSKKSLMEIQCSLSRKFGSFKKDKKNKKSKRIIESTRV